MADAPVELIIPGLFDSGPDHWQSHWVATRPRAVRVELGRWHAPSRDLWVAHLDRAIGRQRGPVVLVAHSLGCLAVAWWAPPDVDRVDAHALLQPFAPAPSVALPFRSLLVASRDDRYADFASLARLADIWAADLADVGLLGHINAESDLGDWPQGQSLLDRLITGHDDAPIPHPAAPFPHPVTKGRHRP